MHTSSKWHAYIPRHIKSLLHLFACESDWAYEVPAVALHTAAVFIVHTVVARCYCYYYYYYYCPNTLSFILLLPRHLVELSLRLLLLTLPRPYTCRWSCCRRHHYLFHRAVTLLLLLLLLHCPFALLLLLLLLCHPVELSSLTWSCQLLLVSP